jgi:microcystin-dependent protein
MANPEELNLTKEYGELFQINSPYLSLSEYDSTFLAYLGLEIQGDNWIHKFKAIKATDNSLTTVRFSSPLSGSSRIQTYLIKVNAQEVIVPSTVYRSLYYGLGELFDDTEVICEIKLFPFTYQINGFLVCNGAPVAASENPDFRTLMEFVYGSFQTGIKVPDLISPLDGLSYQICTIGSFPVQLTRSPDELTYRPASGNSGYFIGEIVLAKNVGKQESQWLTPCDGRTIPINQYTQVLYTLTGGQFGGDFRYTTFNLPDLSAVESPVPGTKYYIVTHGRYPARY